MMAMSARGGMAWQWATAERLVNRDGCGGKSMLRTKQRERQRGSGRLAEVRQRWVIRQESCHR